MPKPKGNEVKINYRSVKVAILEVKQLTKIYGTKKMAQEVLRDINMSIEEGEFIAIMGPSGSGKTTLLNVLSSIDYISQGSITLKGKKLEKLSNKELSDIRKHDIGFIFQEYNLLHTLTVKENIMLPLTVQKLDKEHMLNRYEKVAEALIYWILVINTLLNCLVDKDNEHLLQERLLHYLLLYLLTNQQVHWILKVLKIY